MQNNIVNTLNKMDSEMVEFLKKYWEQQQITSKITEIVKDVITTIAEENKKLKEPPHCIFKKLKNKDPGSRLNN